MDRATVYADDPAGQAELFYKQNATHLHVAELDGAFAGCSVNTEAVEGILKAFKGKVQHGGGIRHRGANGRLISLGVPRVVICPEALETYHTIPVPTRAYPCGHAASTPAP